MDVWMDDACLQKISQWLMTHVLHPLLCSHFWFTSSPLHWCCSWAVLIAYGQSAVKWKITLSKQVLWSQLDYKASTNLLFSTSEAKQAWSVPLIISLTEGCLFRRLRGNPRLIFLHQESKELKKRSGHFGDSCWRQSNKRNAFIKVLLTWTEGEKKIPYRYMFSF